MKNFRNLVLFGLAGTLFFNCSDDDDVVVVNQEETITTVTLTLTNTADATDVVTLVSLDADGDGPGTAVQTPTAPVLAANATYSGVVKFENALEDPVEDITLEVITEKDEHFITYAVSGLDVTLTRNDTTANTRTDGNQLGIDTTWATGAASTGNLQVQLFHEPTTVSDDDEFGTQTGGETDVTVTFTGITIQ